MLARLFLAAVMTLTAVTEACGQITAPGSEDRGASAWRRAGEEPASPSAVRAATASSAETSPAAATVSLTADTARQPITRVTKGTGSLPNQHGQVWREYDVSPYTVRVTTTNRPEQAIVDWILRETGYEVWHSEPLGILSATSRTLRVYHTPKMQAVVAELVDRFVSSEADTCTFSLRVVTVDHPNWRARAQQLLRPVAVQTPGVGAWLLAKEDAAVLVADLRRRNDYREHSSPHLLVNNGQQAVISAMRSRPYVREVVLRPEVWPGFEAEPAQVDEGFSLEFSPLLSLDRRMIDAVIRCNIDQVEKMVPVMLEVPSAISPRQRTKIEVPQITQFRFHERFRWPIDQVLLVEMGMVALPVPVDGKPLVSGIPLPLGKTPARADLLVLVEAKGRTGQAPRVTRTPQREAKSYRGRY